MKFSALLLFSLLLAGFRADDPTYRQQLDDWHRQRTEALRREDGWLNLAGLFWLKDGDNTLGSDPASDLVFPSKAPARLGTFHLVNGTVQFIPFPGQAVRANDQPLDQPTLVFGEGLARPLTLQHGSLRWFVIKRGERVAVRLRDLESPLLTSFAGIERFTPDRSWRVTARLERPTQPRTIAIVDITGQTTQQPLAGTLVFNWAGQTYRLDAVGEGTENLFIPFGDATNGNDTYGSGRFVYADRPSEDGTTVLDFNRAINPPCAFTAFATCPLPPRQNQLSMAVRAGEKKYGNH